MPHKDPAAKAAYQLAYNRGRRAKTRVYNAEYRRVHGDRPLTPRSVRMNTLRRYGLSIAEYEAIFEAQGGLCAICGRPERKRYQGRIAWLAVDHDHLTGAIRALLCHSCNTGLGAFDDSRMMLARAMVYLEEHHVRTR